MISDEADEVIKNVFDSHKNIYQNNFETMRGNDFIIDYVQLLNYKYNKMNLNCGGSFIDSPDWIRNKKATISLINEKSIFFQYAVTVALNYEEMKKDTQRKIKIKSFINKYYIIRKNVRKIM